MKITLKPKEAKPMPEYVDITPSWSGILPLLLAAYENGSFQGKAEAIIELKRMAKLADQWVAHEKAAKDAEEA
jgi:hypothetical protein